jgi:hypothetical protein
MEELRLIMMKESAIRIIPLIRLNGGLAPQASPMMREPRLGSRNSALETAAKDFKPLDMIFQRLKCSPS